MGGSRAQIPPPAIMTKIVILPQNKAQHTGRTHSTFHQSRQVPVSFTEPQTGLKEAATEEAADTMWSLSVSTHRGLVHWQGLLLVGK